MAGVPVTSGCKALRDGREKDGNMSRSIGNESAVKKLALTSFTFFVSYFMQALYGFTDLIVVGRYCTVSTSAAVASGSLVMHLVIVVAVSLAVGTADAIKKVHDKGDNETTERVIGATVAFYGAVAVGAYVILSLLTPMIASLLNLPSAAVDQTKVYLHVSFIGIPFIALTNLSNSTYRGLGDSRSPMIILFLSCIFNVFLSVLLVGKYNMGVYGAAIGTVASQVLNALVCIVHIHFFLKNRGLRVKLRYIRFDRKIIRPITEVGYPLAVHDCMIQLAFLIITMILNRRGLVDCAATGIVEKAMAMLLLISSAVNSGVSVLSREELEKDESAKARNYLYLGLLFAGLTAIILNAFIQIFPEEIVSFFTLDKSVIINGAKYLRGYSIGLVFAAVHYVYTGYFNALGLSGISYVHNIISSVFLRIPGVYFISIMYPRNLYPVGIASASGAVFSAIICLCIYFYLVRAGRNKLRMKKVISDSEKLWNDGKLL